MARTNTIRIHLDAGANVRPRHATDLVTSMELGQQLCAAFGLSADRTRRITIDLEAGTAATVTVEQFITRGQADELEETMATTYGLHRADPARQLHPGFTIRDQP